MAAKNKTAKRPKRAQCLVCTGKVKLDDYRMRGRYWMTVVKNMMDEMCPIHVMYFFRGKPDWKR